MIGDLNRTAEAAIRYHERKILKPYREIDPVYLRLLSAAVARFDVPPFIVWVSAGVIPTGVEMRARGRVFQNQIFGRTPLPYSMSEDLENLIRNRALNLVGEWPPGMVMHVEANSSGFNVHFDPVIDLVSARYRSGVVAIVASIRIECEKFSRERRLRTAC